MIIIIDSLNFLNDIVKAKILALIFLVVILIILIISLFYKGYRCKACQSNNVELFEDHTDIEHCIDTYKCKDCDHVDIKEYDGTPSDNYCDFL